MISVRKKVSYLCLVILILGVACLSSFELIGSTIDDKGFLHEPFFLVIIGWFLVGLGTIGLILCCIIYSYLGSPRWKR